MAEIFGFCDPRFQSLRDLFESNLDTGLDEGASRAVTLNGTLVVDLWGGTRDLARSRPWEEDTLALLFSTGKVVVNMAVLMVWDRGLLDIDAPVATYWPEFGGNGTHSVTTRQVLTHQSGVPGFGRYVAFEEVLDWKHIVEVVEAAPLWFMVVGHPGNAFMCSDSDPGGEGPAHLMTGYAGLFYDAEGNTLSSGIGPGLEVDDRGFQPNHRHRYQAWTIATK